MARPKVIKTGPAHHRTRWPSKVVERARLLQDRGYKPSEVKVHLEDEGYLIPYDTIAHWLRFVNRISG